MANRRDREYIRIKDGNTKYIFNPKDYPFALNEIQALMLERLGDKNFTHYPSDKVLKRFRLWWVQRGFCFWCQQPMTFGMFPDGKIPPTECTIDHLDSRNTNRRGAYINKEMIRQVGACQKCNHDRGKQEDKQRAMERKML